MSTLGPAGIAMAIGANIRAERARRGMDQDAIVDGMRALGHGNWHQQTVSQTEHAKRRVTAAEIVALASILGVPVSTLMDMRAEQQAAGLTNEADRGSRP